MAPTAAELLDIIADLTRKNDLVIPLEPTTGIKNGLCLSLSAMIGAAVCKNYGLCGIFLGSVIGAIIGRAVTIQNIPAEIFLLYLIGLDQQVILIERVYRIVKDREFKSKDEMMTFLEEEDDDAVRMKSLIRSAVNDFICYGFCLQLKQNIPEYAYVL